MKPTKEILKELKGLESKATPGPWEISADDGWPVGSFSTGNSGEDGKDYAVQCVGNRASDLCDSGSTLDAKDDAKFIAKTRTALPKLIFALEKALSYGSCYCTDEQCDYCFMKDEVQRILSGEDK